MRTHERLSKLKSWLERELCAGREYKSPVPVPGKTGIYGPEITDFTMAAPRVFLAYQPSRPDEPGRFSSQDPYSVCPSITVMPCPSYARFVKEQRFDRYNNIHRPQEMGQALTVQLLFSIYEPGIRLPGFADGIEDGDADMSLIKDGSEAGLFTLTDWMDDALELILREHTVPDTDMILDDDSLMYSLYTDQSFVVDRRPIYYGFINAEWKCYADRGSNDGSPSRASRLLDGILD